MQIIQSFITQNPTFTSPRTITPRGLMLHSVGTPQPDAKVFVNNWNRSSAQVSVHGVVGTGGTVYQTLPFTHRAWHAGGDANNTHIGVEMVEPSTIRYTSGANFTDNDPAKTRAFVQDTYQTATQLFAKLCKDFSLNPTASGVIISHSEGHRRGVASNHADVEHLWSRHGLTMDNFRRDVAALMAPTPTPPTPPPPPSPPPQPPTPQPPPVSAALGRALDSLLAAGVITDRAYWANAAPTLRYLETVLIRLGNRQYGQIREFSSVCQAIDALTRAGVFADPPEYWWNNVEKVRYLPLLLRRAAASMKG